ncbi:amylo-alpha-1,6-glucosidase [Tenuifilum sp.]|uniref:amylo-alpha-1,6-glucosidase n=1 Tax=Tenuifilum sp. TaxID=2760880 RepID=UPI002C20671B|nr:amylo-alpha-1,6-glucosidase [Tenuifilum sp.]HOK84866.1 amylo-alpha-1,6-glucosidase [Tenuifilum sp.]HPP89703.1 amylo-alpha-1,6-glucosidase [Tenuifilum sp.]
MKYLSFDKEQLVNLEYSLNREILSTNRAGGYFSTTIILCNTRKYHGLMILPIDEFDGENHVLLSCVDETVIQHGQTFNLGIHRYPGIYEPRGHKYIIDFSYEPTPTLTYQVGGVIFKKELLFVHNEEQFMIRYTLVDAHSSTHLRIKPFLAFRNVHNVSKANMWANTKFQPCANGVKYKLYTGFPTLHLQLNKKNEFVACPDWYYNIEYMEELKRGYEGHEDLFVPGYFEIPIKKGESVIFSAATEEQTPSTLLKKFNAEILRRPAKDSYKACMENSARQFIVHKGKSWDIIAGYPWFGSWGRDSFISLPGLTLGIDDPKMCKTLLDSLSAKLKNGLFPNMGNATSQAFNSVDAPLWYFWAIQQYYLYTNDHKEVWHDYAKKMKTILKGFRDGLPFNIKMHDNGLIWAGERGYALTWMDAVVYGKPVTPRIGYPVEINALWYNAIMFTIDLATKNKDYRFVKEWLPIAERAKASFNNLFWLAEKGYLADFVDEDGPNTDIRPNQIFAISLPYTPLDEDKMPSVLKIVEKELYTPKGLRTLSPNNPHYKGRYEGDQPTRDSAYHQGAAWPWLLGAYVEAHFRLNPEHAINVAENILESFQEDISIHGICTISEVYDGDPPQRPNGCISQAWSVAELIRIYQMVEKHKSGKGK